MSQILKVYFFCTFLGYNLYFFSRFFVLFWGDEPVATLLIDYYPPGNHYNPIGCWSPNPRLIL